MLDYVVTNVHRGFTVAGWNSSACRDLKLRERRGPMLEMTDYAHHLGNRPNLQHHYVRQIGGWRHRSIGSEAITTQGAGESNSYISRYGAAICSFETARFEILPIFSSTLSTGC